MMQEDSRRMSSSFPDVFPISLSHSEFPYSYNMASVDELGSPLGCIITPYIKRSDRTHLVMKTHPTIPISTDIARCFNCQSYINPFCDVTTIRWYCSLCSSKNIFPRKSQKSSQSQRYQRAGTGILPETQDILVDYPMPYREEIDGYIPKKHLGKTSIPSIDRPLVHIFLVQENMALDTMEAVVEGLTATMEELHPDIQVILMSYSNRIGIYRLSDEIGLPTVQYIHMATSNGQGNVFEGRELQDLVGDENDEGIQNVEVITPLSNVISFKKAAKRLGDCRRTLEMAISSILDSEPIKTDSITPHNHIGPVLQAISDWILKSPDGDLVFNSVDTSESESALQTISNIKDITLNLLGLQSGRDRQSKESNRKDDNFRDAPVDSCSGVILNLFISSKQDLPIGAHESVSLSSKKSNKIGENSQTEVNRQWAEKLGKYFCKKSLGVNIWAITSFEGQEIGLWGLSPLADRTGGYINRFILGDYPKDERIRFTKMLSKVLKNPLATKCILKVRTSSLVEIDENSFIGHATSDDELPGIFRVSSCTPDEGFAFYINFKHDALAQDQHPQQIQNRTAVLQVAFSYDTLVEDDQVLDNDSNINQEVHDNKDNIDRKYVKSISEILNMDIEVSDILPKKDTMNEERPKRLMLKEDGEYYNFSKRLVSVRRLRVITIMIECSPRMARMIQVAHIPTIASLITRQAIMFNNGQQNEGELILGQNNVGAQLVVDWAISIVNSLVTLLYKNYLDANKMNQKAIPLDPAELVADAIKHLQDNRCLQVLFGAFNIMAQTCLKDGYRPDSAVELSTMLERIDSYHSEIILYPFLFPISKEGFLEDKIPLRREAMITNSAHSYLLDAGYEMVLYQNRPSSKLSQPLPQKTSVIPYDSKPVAPLPKWGPPTVILNDNKVQTTELQSSSSSSLDIKGEEKTSSSSELKPSKLFLKLFQRINLSHGIPHIYASEAGTSSSRYLTSHLFEDSIYYSNFIEHISQQTLQDFKKNNKLK